VSDDNEQHAAAEKIRPFRKSQLGKAAAFLFDTYRDDPAFTDLYGFRTEAEVEGALGIFSRICLGTAAIQRATLGCYRSGKLVGVVSYYPSLCRLSLRIAARHPAVTAMAYARGAYLTWRFRPRFRPAARVRWRAYGRLIAAQTKKPLPRLHITALGVAESARRTGVARRLLEAVANEEQWRDRVEALEVNTWNPAKVMIYERLGFESIAHGAQDGVQCWTMLRPLEA